MFNLGESKLNLRLGQRFDSVNFVISNFFLLINKVRFVSGNEFSDEGLYYKDSRELRVAWRPDLDYFNEILECLKKNC